MPPKMNEQHHPPRLADRFLTRRDFLHRCGMGFGMVGLANLLGPQMLGAALSEGEISSISPLAVKSPHFPAKAKRVIHIFANGGPSHLDTFDPKPKLSEWHGKEIPTKLQTERK